MEDIWKNIYESTLKFLVPQSLEEVYPVIVNEAIHLVGGSYGSIFIIKGTRPIRVYASSDKLFNIIPRRRGNTYRVYETTIPSLVQRKHLVPNPYLLELNIESDLTVPLVHGHITIGVLSIMSVKGHKFGEREIETLMAFAPLAALALRKAYLNEELYKAIEARDLFMSLAAHELKTPITVISAYTELLLRNSKQDINRSYAVKIHNELHRVKNLVNEFLHIDSEKERKLTYNMKNCDLVDIFTTAIDNYQKTKTHYKIKFKNKVPIGETIILCDSEKLVEVLFNVLDNAVKFSPKHSTIITSLKKSNGIVHLTVKDSGDGISKEDLKHLFQRFYRGSSDKPGMGLGLYLAKQIIEAHNGSIKIRSKVGEGTTAQISLPAHIKNDIRKS